MKKITFKVERKQLLIERIGELGVELSIHSVGHNISNCIELNFEDVDCLIQELMATKRFMLEEIKKTGKVNGEKLNG